jgi:flagellar assembly protein FliH
MALIKSHSASDMNDAIVLDLGDLRRQATDLRGQAEAQAKRILADAREQARRLTEGAEAIGRQAGFDAGYAAGLEEGNKVGHVGGLAQASAALMKLQEAWIAAAQTWDEQRRQMVLEAQQSVLELAVEMARKIVQRVPRIDPSIVVDQVSAALDHVTRPCDVVITIHPQDRPLVEQALPALVRNLSQTQHASLAEDANIAPGGCVVTYGRGQIDATLKTQLDRLVHTLLGDEPPITTPPASLEE